VRGCLVRCPAQTIPAMGFGLVSILTVCYPLIKRPPPKRWPVRQGSGEEQVERRAFRQCGLTCWTRGLRPTIQVTATATALRRCDRRSSRSAGGADFPIPPPVIAPPESGLRVGCNCGSRLPLVPTPSARPITGIWIESPYITFR